MKNNLFANVMLGLIGILLILAALQMFGWGRGTASLEAELFDVSTLSKLEVSKDLDTDDQSSDQSVVQITDAPLFSFDRLPYIAPVDGEGELEEDLSIVEAEPLKAKVTSIIITGENSYAMVLDELSNEHITLKQGMPLPGEQGLWVVDSINPRHVTFAAEGEEPIEIGLEVFSGQLNKNTGNQNNNRRNNKQKQDKNKVDTEINNQQAQKNSAEEIRRKIAERRAQMRANAAKGNKE